MPPHTEEQKAKDRAYYEKNKERIKEYNEKNKERIREYYQSENGKKSQTIGQWKYKGLIGDYDEIYEKYINSTHCDLCKKPYKNTKDRHMEHCHRTQQFRHICCQSCNTNMLDRTINTNNKSGIKNVSKYRNGWRYNKRFNKQYFSYYNTNKNLVLWAKFYDHIMLSNLELCCDID